MNEAYEQWHDRGFDILGISLDNAGMRDTLVAFLEEHDVRWPQIYEGLGRNSRIAELYDVSHVPFVLLVDGSTGEILATGRQLQGSNLREFVETVLTKKRQ